jgi:glycosyltransferase involved in cell wall biosynthesis
MPQRNLLLIAYLFPPAGGITVQRALSLARYLPAHGFKVHVLQAANAPTPVVDKSLLGRIPPEVVIHRAFTPEPPFRLRHAVWGVLGDKQAGTQPSKPSAPPSGPKQWAKNIIKRVLCPEPEILWVPFAIRKARRIVRKHQIDAVMVTAPPFSAFLAGVALKREFPHLALISDFRDEWLDFYLNESDYQSGEYTRRRATEIEHEVIEASDRVVAVTHSTLATIRRRYPAQPASKFVCVENGFDPIQFEGFQPRPHHTGKVVITHVGTATNASTPRFFLDAVESLPQDLRARLEIRFVGRIANAERLVFENRTADIRCLGFMPQPEATRYMEETDYLLMTMTNPISMPGKCYEYLATGKPVLAITPRGSEVDLLVRGQNLGFCAEPSDPAGLAEMLSEAIRAADSRDTRFRHISQVASHYTRPALVAQYGVVIQEALAAGPGQPSRAIEAAEVSA